MWRRCFIPTAAKSSTAENPRVMQSQPIWSIEKTPAYPRLEHDVHADVLIVGGGIAGVTAAYLLKKAGRSVVLLERERLGAGQTGHTTAHLTYPTDRRLESLMVEYGPEVTRTIWQ